MKVFHLDTNTIIYALKGQYNLKDKFFKYQRDQIKISAIVKAELIYGAHKSKKKKDNLSKIQQFLDLFEIIPFDNFATTEYVDIRSSLEIKGKIIGPNDLLIAATALSRNATLITRNLKEFKRIDHLKIENWAK